MRIINRIVLIMQKQRISPLLRICQAKNTRAGQLVRFLSEEVKHAALGFNFPYHRTSGGAFWIYEYCGCGGGDCQSLVLPVPGDLPDLFCYGHIGRQKSSLGNPTTWIALR